jgi:hypothetical protein
MDIAQILILVGIISFSIVIVGIVCKLCQCIENLYNRSYYTEV